MTPLEIQTVIKQQVYSNWSTLTPVAWQGKSFDPDTDAPAGEYLQLTTVMAESEIGELGSEGLGFRYGVIFGNIFVNENTGTIRALTLATAFENMFRRSESVADCMILDEPTTDEKGVDDQGKYQVTVTIPFTAFIDEQIVQKPVGSFATPQVSFVCSSTGASIFYTTDGTVPDSSSTEYTSPITITETTAFKVIGIKSGLTSSGILEYGAYVEEEDEMTTTTKEIEFTDLSQEFDLFDVTGTIYVEFLYGTVTEALNSEFGDCNFTLYNSDSGISINLTGPAASNDLPIGSFLSKVDKSSVAMSVASSSSASVIENATRTNPKKGFLIVADNAGTTTVRFVSDYSLMDPKDGKINFGIDWQAVSSNGSLAT